MNFVTLLLTKLQILHWFHQCLHSYSWSPVEFNPGSHIALNHHVSLVFSGLCRLPFFLFFHDLASFEQCWVDIWKLSLSLDYWYFLCVKLGLRCFWVNSVEAMCPPDILSGYGISAWLTSGHVDLDRLGGMVPARFLRCKVCILPFPSSVFRKWVNQSRLH